MYLFIYVKTKQNKTQSINQKRNKMKLIIDRNENRRKRDKSEYAF